VALDTHLLRVGLVELRALERTQRIESTEVSELSFGTVTPCGAAIFSSAVSFIWSSIILRAKACTSLFCVLCIASFAASISVDDADEAACTKSRSLGASGLDAVVEAASVGCGCDCERAVSGKVQASVQASAASRVFITYLPMGSPPPRVGSGMVPLAFAQSTCRGDNPLKTPHTRASCNAATRAR
jgi:hypothetical protein